MNCFIIHIISQRSSKSLSISGGHGGREKIKNADMQMFLILLLVTFTFLILTTPAYLLFIYVMFVNYEESAESFADFTLFYSIAQKTYYTNYAMNFFLYVISGKKFRADLVQLLKQSARNRPSVSGSQSNITFEFFYCLRPVHLRLCYRRDSIQGTDYNANPFVLNLKVSKTTIENLR